MRNRKQAYKIRMLALRLPQFSFSSKTWEKREERKKKKRKEKRLLVACPIQTESGKQKWNIRPKDWMLNYYYFLFFF